jgi:tRNA1Val (adenine37-N6)-methyltransferase
MDPFFLAAWALEGGPPGRFLDAGTGSGIVALLLGRLGHRGQGLDIQPAWIDRARQSAARSGLDAQLDFVQGDLRTAAPGGFDLALCNPPYFPVGAGPLPADPLKAAARHALFGDLDALLPALARLAPRVALILPPRRAAEAEARLAAAGRPLRRRCRLGSALVLLEGQDGGGPLHDEAFEPRGADGAPHPRVVGWYAALGARLAQIGAVNRLPAAP